MQYSKLYATKAQKAIDTGLVDLKAFIEEMRQAGTSDKNIEEMLLDDLENDGPLFGKFFRSLGVAGEGAISNAEAQAASIAEAMTGAEELKALVEEANISSEEMLDRIVEATPEELEEMEINTEDLVYTWICTLQKTCDVCLPLHGQALTKAEWRERGLIPREVHSSLGWASPCQCNWVLTQLAESRADLIDPLVRIKITDPETGTKKTIRGVTQHDVDKARIAAEKAKESLVGRRTLRLLGQVNKGG
jgi:hypothetical protein